jgi:hypothetical protein
MRTIGQDVRYGWRMPSRCPGWAAVAVLILHTGLGASASAPATTLGASMASLPLAAEANQAAPDEASVSKRARPVSETGKPSPLLAWWRFDESEGRTAVDSSGHSFAGTLIGNPRWQPTGGRVKGALAFDGAQDAVLIGNAPAFNITGAITIAAWIKVSRFDQRWQTIIAKGDTAWRLQRAAEEDTVAFHCTGLNSVKGRWPLGIEGKKRVNDGQWHHVAGVYDGAVVSLYVDGVLDNSSRASGTIQTNGLPVVIGANAEASGRNWSGLIDEACVFACALNASGVKALYAGQDPAVLVEQPSALVSDDDVQAERRASEQDHAATSPPDKKLTPTDKRGGWRGPLVVLFVAGVALTAGVYVVRRGRSKL